MRSARSASRVRGVWGGSVCGGRWPLWPSLMAVVERAESEVVVLVGVPLQGMFVSFRSVPRGSFALEE